MTTIDIARHPVLDRQTLDNLGVELSSRDGALQFAGTFSDMLPRRVDAVEAAFAAGNGDAAVVALLSLKVSAAMVGARRLEEMSSTALGLLGGTAAAHAGAIAHLRSYGAEFESVIGGIIR